MYSGSISTYKNYVPDYDVYNYVYRKTILSPNLFSGLCYSIDVESYDIVIRHRDDNEIVVLNFDLFGLSKDVGNFADWCEISNILSYFLFLYENIISDVYKIIVVSCRYQ